MAFKGRQVDDLEGEVADPGLRDLLFRKGPAAIAVALMGPGLLSLLAGCTSAPPKSEGVLGNITQIDSLRFNGGHHHKTGTIDNSSFAEILVTSRGTIEKALLTIVDGSKMVYSGEMKVDKNINKGILEHRLLCAPSLNNYEGTPYVKYFMTPQQEHMDYYDDAFPGISRLDFSKPCAVNLRLIGSDKSTTSIEFLSLPAIYYVTDEETANVSSTRTGNSFELNFYKIADGKVAAKFGWNTSSDDALFIEKLPNYPVYELRTISYKVLRGSAEIEGKSLLEKAQKTGECITPLILEKVERDKSYVLAIEYEIKKDGARLRQGKIKVPFIPNKIWNPF